jgi:hypothetical protein
MTPDDGIHRAFIDPLGDSNGQPSPGRCSPPSTPPACAVIARRPTWR